MELMHVNSLTVAFTVALSAHATTRAVELALIEDELIDSFGSYMVSPVAGAQEGAMSRETHQGAIFMAALDYGPDADAGGIQEIIASAAGRVADIVGAKEVATMSLPGFHAFYPASGELESASASGRAVEHGSDAVGGDLPDPADPLGLYGGQSLGRDTVRLQTLPSEYLGKETQ